MGVLAFGCGAHVPKSKFKSGGHLVSTWVLADAVPRSPRGWELPGKGAGRGAWGGVVVLFEGWFSPRGVRLFG